MHCATSRKVTGSIPDRVIGIFRLHNPSGRTMTLGLTQSLTEMSTRNISWEGKDGRCVGLTTLPPSCADCLEIWELQPSGPSGPVQACNGIALQFYQSRVPVRGIGQSQGLYLHGAHLAPDWERDAGVERSSA